MNQDENSAINEYEPEIELSLRDYVRVVLSRKWIVISIFFLIVFSTIFYLITAKPVYQAEVVMMQEQSEKYPSTLMQIPLLTPSESVDSYKEIIKSSSSISEIQKNLKLNYREEFTEEEIEKNLELSSDRNSSIIKLDAKASTAKRAQNLANTAADTLIKKITYMKSSDLSQGLTFLDSQLKTVNNSLISAEKELNDFMEKEGITYLASAPSSSSGVQGELISKVNELEDELSKTETEYETTKAQLQSVQKLISSKKKLFTEKNGSPTLGTSVEQIQSKLMDLEIQLDTLREKYTDKDPNVLAIQQQINALEKRLGKELAKVSGEKTGVSLDPVSELQGLISQSISLNSKLSGLKQRKTLFENKIKAFKKKHPELPATQMRLLALRRQTRVYEETYTTLMERREEMRLLKEMKTSGLGIIDLADLPKFPVSPRKKLTVLLGVVLGLMLSVGTAFFLEYLDDSIKIREDVDRYLGLSIIGTIPKIKPPFKVPEAALPKRERKNNTNSSKSLDSSNLLHAETNPLNEKDSSTNNTSVQPAQLRRRKKSKGHRETSKQLLSHILLFADKKSPVVNSYQTLAANIRYAGIDTPIKSLLLTSAAPEEGKTATSVNLAISLARAGQKVLLVDADLRKRRIHRIFQQESSPGLTDFLVDEIPDKTPPIRPTEVDNLYVFTAGSHVSNPDMLISSEKMKNLLRSLKEEYDIIVIDSAPLLLAADSIILATEVDKTLLVIRSGKTKRQVAVQAKEQLENVGAEILGTVLNEVDHSKQYGSYYYYYRSYYSYYSSDEEDEG